MSETLPTAMDVALESRALGIAIEPFELHGSLCGWLAGGGRNDPNWIAAVMADASLPAETADSALETLRNVTALQLTDRDFSLELLLADEEASLGERSGSLFSWCRGFLGGFGLAAGAAPPLSDESREALTDLAKLASAQAQDEGDQEDEQALVEIEEFVRVSALLLHGDCVLGPSHRQRLH